MRLALLLATLAGLIAAVFVIGSVGLGSVVIAVRTIGIAGFLTLWLYSLGIVLILGLAWFAAAPGADGHFGAFLWGRILREAANDVLPLSQLGGVVLGARAVATQGVREPLVNASLVIDLSAEMAGQLFYTLFGIAILAGTVTGASSGLLATAIGGAAIVAGLFAIVALGQRPILRLFQRATTRFLPRIANATGAMRAELDCIRHRPGRIVLSFLLHLTSWFGAGAGAWIVLRLSGSDLPLLSILAMEALIFAIRSIAFVVPGAIGVQEGAYALIGPVFGLSPELSIALSLVKRARDLAIGVPALLLWQALEGRALMQGALKKN